MVKSSNPVLIIGGSGIVGSRTAHILRKLQPDLPIAIGGRDVEKANRVAQEVGNAVGLQIDLDREDLGLTPDASFGAVAIYLKDDTLNSMRYAQAAGIPYVSVSSGTFEIGPEVALFIHGAKNAPILLASQWLAGASVVPTLHYAADYETLDSIRIGAMLDEEDMGGPAAYTDYERITGAAPAALTLQNGKYIWVTGEEAKSVYRGVDGIEAPADAYSPLDIVSLGAATDARSVRLDLVVGMSAARREGQAVSTEIVLELEGWRKNGQRGRSRHEIVHPEGQAPLTALSVALSIERLLGLAGGPPVQGGLYLPEILLDPAYYVRRMEDFGATFKTTLSE